MKTPLNARRHALLQVSSAAQGGSLRARPVDSLLDTSPRQLLQRQRIDALHLAGRPSTSTHTAPLQRKLKLSGEPELRDTNLADLNRMLAGTAARVGVDGDGNVSFESLLGQGDPVDHEGFRLLKALIDQTHLVEVGYDKQRDNALAKAHDTEAASNPKLGSGSFLNLSRDYESEDMVKHQEGGQIKKETTPRFMVLAHELIHSLHYAEGRRATKGRVEYPVKGKFEGRVLTDNSMYGSREEEVNTVGLGSQQPGAITENALRDRLKLPIRPVYEGDIEGLATWLRSRLEPAEQSTGKATASKARGRSSSMDLKSPPSALGPLPFPGYGRAKKEDEKK